MLCATLCITMVLNSCRIHAEFMLISCWFYFHLNFHNALCNTLRNNGVEFMLNSCWIHAEFKQFREKYIFFTILAVFWKTQAVFLIVYSINNPVKCFKCHFIGKFRYFSRFCLNSAWIQHKFNANVMQNVAQSVVKLQGKNEISMNSAWIQHEFDMNSTPASNFAPKSWKKPPIQHQISESLKMHEFSMNLTWIWHEWKYNVTRLNMHEFSMNPAWKRYESDSMFFWKKGQKKIGPDLFEWWFGLVLWSWRSQNIRKIHSCWIHAFPRNSLESIFFDSKSKPPIQNAAENLENFGNFSIYLGCSMVLNSCWIHAGFMLNSCIFRRVTLYFHSCQIHAEFMHFQWFWDLVLNWRFFSRFWCKFGWGEAGVEFMSNSCWIHADFIFTLKFHNALRNILHHIGNEFMLNLCWIQAKPWKIPKFANKVACEAFNWILYAIYY